VPGVGHDGCGMSAAAAPVVAAALHVADQDRTTGGEPMLRPVGTC
jgi:hypothetical protein